MKPAYPISVRPATPDDARAMAELSHKVFIETFVDEFGIDYPRDDLEPFLAKAHGEAQMRAWVADENVGVWVVRDEGQIVGYAATGPVGLPHPDIADGEVELYRLYVDKAHHGRGISGGLMEQALNWMDQKSDGAHWLGVWSENHRAQRFYARYGFEWAGEYEYMVGKTADHEFILRRAPIGGG